MFNKKSLAIWPLMVILACVSLLFSNAASAAFTHFIYMSSPCSHGEGEIGVVNNGSSCSAVNIDTPTMWGTGQKYGSVNETLGGLNGAYVAASGLYKLRMYWCEGVYVGGCSIKSSVMSVTSAGQAFFQSSLPITSQDADFGGGPSGTVARAGAMCFTLISPDGTEWGVAGNKRFCGDSHPLPVVPTECSLNYGSELNVEFGNLERASLPTSKLNATGNVKINKTIPVTCSGDASIALRAQIDYTASSFDQDAAMTSNKNLAIALIHEGAVFNTADRFDINVPPGGVTDINLDFVAFRNPSVHESDVDTGNFNASMAMILTEF